MKVICPHCQTEYTLGVNGIEASCDSCAGVQRDRKGYAWLPDERYSRYQDVGTGKKSIVRRDKAIGVKA